MSSLVLELQQLALDKKTDISELLNKAYAVAYKLNLSSFRRWAEFEMKGYFNKKMPPYRRIQGQVVCMNPFRGWIPFVCRNDPTFQANLSTRWLNTPIAVLQEFLQRNTDSSSIISFEPELENLLMSDMGAMAMRPALEVPISAYVMILETVRSTILTWSLKLEADGILGENLTFTPEEKKTAVEKQSELRPVVVNITTNAVGTMDKSAIQQSSPEAEMYFDPDEEATSKQPEATQTVRDNQ